MCLGDGGVQQGKVGGMREATRISGLNCTEIPERPIFHVWVLLLSLSVSTDMDWDVAGTGQCPVVPSGRPSATS